MPFSSNAIEEIARKKAGMYALLQMWSGKMTSHAKEHAEWRDRTTHARNALHSGVERVGDTFFVYLAHGILYGEYLEEGTGLHGPKGEKFEIRPKNKKALFFPGAPHPVKKVMHPGMKPRAVIRPTLETHIPLVRKSVLDYWED
ncbi:hypothetical protein P4V33_09235 [Brevibacillus borstelensis]|uniref:hypothetical protein n=1 Tax=Brevibacillus borstelensis TaxID=45462 RepID=UPI002E1CBC22|nr:hypothetical protein [Brevibacillus borstelensis]